MFDHCSIQLKLAGSTFLLLAFTVCSLIALTNEQMEIAFGDYLALHIAVMDHGPAEMMFIHSVHQSLWWVGLFFILLGFIITSILAAGITRPLRRLTKAAASHRAGWSFPGMRRDCRPGRYPFPRCLYTSSHLCPCNRGQ